MDRSKEVIVEVPSAVARLVGGIHKITVTMPLDWMVTGYLRAARRVEEAASVSGENARDLCIALFEATNWLDSLHERLILHGNLQGLEGNVHVKALNLVRDRTHHAFGAAVYFDQVAGEWRWYKVSILPAADPGYENEKGERKYEELLAEKPVRAVFERIDKAVRALAPGAAD